MKTKVYDLNSKIDSSKDDLLDKIDKLKTYTTNKYEQYKLLIKNYYRKSIFKLKINDKNRLSV